MLQATVDRLGDLVLPADRVLIATNRSLAAAITEQLPDLPAGAILAETMQTRYGAVYWPGRIMGESTRSRRHPGGDAIGPCHRDRCRISASDSSGRGTGRRAAGTDCHVWNSSHLPGRKLLDSIERGERLAQLPASEIWRRTRLELRRSIKVRQFREKPKADVAKQYLAAGDFYWNSGIFVWKATTILAALTEHQPQMVAHLQKIAQAWDTPGYQEVLDREFAAIKGVSIDYAVMEHAQNVAVIEAPFTWDDLGSWQSLARLLGADADGNTIVGRHLGIQNPQGIRFNAGRRGNTLVVTLGLRDCLVVHIRLTPHDRGEQKHDEESIRKVVQLLKERGWGDVL